MLFTFKSALKLSKCGLAAGERSFENADAYLMSVL